MIDRPSDKVIEALAMLEHNSHFIAIIEWLKESRRLTLEQLGVERDADECRRLQGSSNDLADVLKAANEARDIISRRKK